MNMEVYKFLGDDSRRQYDAIVVSLMLRGKSLLRAIKMAEFSLERQILRSEPETNPLDGIHTPERTTDVLKKINELCTVNFKDCSYGNDELDSISYDLNDETGDKIYIYIPNSNKDDLDNGKWGQFIIEIGEYADPKTTVKKRSLEGVVHFVESYLAKQD